MELVFPSIRNKYFGVLSLCGQVDWKKTEIPKPIRESMGKAFLAKHQIGRMKIDVRLQFGGDSEEHMHIDIVKEKSPFKVKRPYTVIPIERVLEKIAAVPERPVKVYASAAYELPVSALPEEGFIKSTFFKTSGARLTIQLRAAQFSLKGMPVTQLGWTLSNDETKLLIEMESRFTRTIHPDYLSGTYQAFDSVFRVFILGRSNGK